ncbi:MAG TPA: hypothetical protein VGO47_00280 [Chlamydiales bacterium]|jgi:hypothetical protein|nr:hypothetical protein [Chlamydiales bacterium]
MSSLFTTSSPGDGPSREFGVKPWPRETDVPLPEEVFEDEADLALHQELYNTDCRTWEETKSKLAELQAKIMKSKADKENKKIEDKCRAKEDQEQID